MCFYSTCNSIIVSLSCLSSDTNGLNPVWGNKFDIDIINPECTLLRFIVQDLDVFGDPIDLAQAVVPVPCIKTGYRSIALRNHYSEELELSSLLVYVEIHKVHTCTCV